MRFNPFRPNSPVNPGMFVGRAIELSVMERALFQTRADNATNFAIVGERGIGKTSLLLYFRYIARGEIDINGDNFHFIVVDLDIEKNTTQVGLIRRIELGLDNELSGNERALRFLKKSWEFLTRLEVLGCKIQDAKADSSPDETLLEEFAQSLSKTCMRLCSNENKLVDSPFDGIAILIDEVDKAQPGLDLGTFLKRLQERLLRLGCNRVLFGLAGLPEMRSAMVESHESSLRLFNEMQLGRLSSSEVHRVIDVCLNEANEHGIDAVKISEEGRKMLTNLSEGYPHFIQQFAYSAFDADSDNIIDENDVTNGAFGPRGAMEAIGDRYYRNDFYNKIQKDSYRQVLRIMSENLDSWVTKDQIRSSFHGNAKTLDNAIQALRNRHIILTKEGSKGTYRLQHKGFALWIRLYANSSIDSEKRKTANTGKTG